MNCDIKSYTIGELCDYNKGASIPRDSTSVNYQIPYLHYGDIYKLFTTYVEYDRVQSSIIKVMPSEKIKSDQLLLDGDIVYNLASETVEDLGKSVMIINPKNDPFIAGMETTVFRIKNKTIVSPKYLQYIFESTKFQALLRQYVTGMKVYRVHPRDLSRIVIDLPSIDVQEKIVAFADDIYNVIDINRKINDYLAA